MSAVTTTLKVFSALSLVVAASACGIEDINDFGGGFAYAEFDYIAPAQTAGDIDLIRGFDARGEVGVMEEDGFFQAVATADVRQGQVMTIIDQFGPEQLSAFAPGTVLHIQSDYGNLEPGTILSTVELDDDDVVVESSDTSVMLCGGDQDGMESEDGYWIDIPAEEAVIEVEATDDPDVNEVTVTAGVENYDGEIDVVTTTFNVNAAQ